MQVDQIITTHDWVRHQQRTKIYRIYEDQLGSTHVRYTEQLWTPYNNRVTPVTAVDKGSHIDKIA